MKTYFEAKFCYRHFNRSRASNRYYVAPSQRWQQYSTHEQTSGDKNRLTLFRRPSFREAAYWHSQGTCADWYPGRYPCSGYRAHIVKAVKFSEKWKGREMETFWHKGWTCVFLALNSTRFTQPHWEMLPRTWPSWVTSFCRFS